MDNLHFSHKKNLEFTNPERSRCDAARVLLPDSDIEWRDEPHFNGESRTRMRSLQYGPEGGAALTLIAAMSEPLDKLSLSDTPAPNARASEAALPMRTQHDQEALRAALVYDWADLYQLPLNTLVENTPFTDALSTSPGVAHDTQHMLDLLTAELRTLHDLEWLADHREGSSLIPMLNQPQSLTQDATPAMATTSEETAPQLEMNGLLFPSDDLPVERNRDEELLTRTLADHDGEEVFLSLQEILGMHDELIAWSATYSDGLNGGKVVEYYPFYIDNHEGWMMTGANEHML